MAKKEAYIKPKINDKVSIIFFIAFIILTFYIFFMFPEFSTIVVVSIINAIWFGIIFVFRISAYHWVTTKRKKEKKR